MAYQLTKDLETGNALIDREHRELIDAINALLNSCSKGQGRNEHFSDEEQLQRQNNYPDYVQHKKYHEAFKKTVADIVARLSVNGPTIALVGEINTALAGWLINHIKKEDKKLAAYLSTR